MIYVQKKHQKIIHREQKQSSFQAIDIGNGVIMEMVYIPGGTFMMGSPENEKGRNSAEGPQDKVTIQPFYMSKYPITQAQWQAVMGNNPSYFKGDNRPVEKVSWHDAVAFCKKLSEKTNQSYHLPSEAQWDTKSAKLICLSCWYNYTLLLWRYDYY